LFHDSWPVAPSKISTRDHYSKNIYIYLYAIWRRTVQINCLTAECFGCINAMQVPPKVFTQPM
jgi:hypothetical protein